MLFKEEFIVEATQPEAWRFFSNFPDPLLVLPGLVTLTEVSPANFVGEAKVGLGPFCFHFKGDLRVLLVEAKTGRVNLTGGAHDQNLGGNFKATAYTQVLPHGPQNSRVTLEVEVGLGGLLGKLGMFILRPAAHRITQHYCQLVNSEIKRRSATPALNSKPAPGRTQQFV